MIGSYAPHGVRAANELRRNQGRGGHGEGDRHLQSQSAYHFRAVNQRGRGALRWELALGLPLLLAACSEPPGFDFAAFDTSTDEDYTGLFISMAGEPTAAVALLGASSGVECQGVTGADETDSIQAGDIANLLVRCDNGRLIREQIV